MRVKVQQKSRWQDLRTRLISAGLLIPIVALAIYIGNLAFALLTGLVVVLAYREWILMVSGQNINGRTYISMGLLALMCSTYPLLGFWGSFVLFTVFIFYTLVLTDHILAVPFKSFGAGFLGIAALCVLALRGSTNTGICAMVLLATVIWLTDSGAFFIGRYFGGIKLSPDISPAKTWSGALGGLVAGVFGGSIVWLFCTQSPLWIGICICAGLSILGQLGDLFESALKRYFLIKDSGNIIPGHGGVLDRIDSLTFGAIGLFMLGAVHLTCAKIAQGILIW